MTATATLDPNLETELDIDCIDLEAGFMADTGEELCVGGRIMGAADTPVFVVLGGISADRRVADSECGAGWWRDFTGGNGPLDPTACRILSIDFVADASAHFPSTRDQAAAILALADAAGVDRLSVIGSSYGGMVALALASLAPERIEKALVISAAHKPSAMARAWRSIQRETVELAIRHGDGKAGLDLARRLAMTTYRTPDEIEDRFFEPDPDSRDANGIEAYLECRGADFTTRMSPERFLALSHSMDGHQVDLSAIECEVTYVAVREDRLVPIEQVKSAADQTPKARFLELSSYYGHDAFLKEVDAISSILAAFTGAGR